jgi:hypothetical protein
MTKKLFSLAILSLASFCNFAGLMQFEGYYSGKNLFIENEFIADANHHCLTNVYVNGKHLADHPTVNIVEINLFGYKIGDTLHFRIYHKDGCSPKIVNRHDIEPNTRHFAFSKVTVSEKNVHWETKGEEPIGKFTLEQEILGEWKTVKNVKGQGTAAANSYFCEAHNLSGINKYRIKYRSSGGNQVISEVFSYTSTLPHVIFYPKRVVDFITFDSEDHREIEYTILDESGTKLFEGSGILIDCRNLPSNKFYTIQYENREEKFFKKDYSEEQKNTEIK